MKRLLASAVGGFLIPFVYLVIAGPLSAYVQNRALLFLLDLPYGWPRVLLYRYCLPRCALDDNTIFLVFMVASNMALYGTLTYFALWLRSHRKPKTYAAPPPPNF
jgi:uncharacterized membrane protein YedE/YeeE